MHKPVIVVLVGGYLPGSKYGGPIRSLTNMVEQLGDKFSFRIITADRDLGDKVPYDSVALDKWVKVGNADVIYLSKGRSFLRRLHRAITKIDYDILYLNSLFSPCYTIAPLVLDRIGRLPLRPILIAPRGELSPGSLSKKSFKKKVFLGTAKVIGLYQKVVWHASSNIDLSRIKRFFGQNQYVMIASNIASAKVKKKSTLSIPHKRQGELAIAYLGRIAYEKNLLAVIEGLKHVNGKVCLNIYGDIDDGWYWEKCLKAIDSLGEDIRVVFHGPIGQDEVYKRLTENHVLTLLSMGENYGHVIVEAFSCGLPVIISDQTPWRNLEEEGVGWDVALTLPGKFVEVLQKCIDLDDSEMKSLSLVVKDYVKEKANIDKSISDTNRMFRSIVMGDYKDDKK